MNGDSDRRLPRASPRTIAAVVALPSVLLGLTTDVAWGQSPTGDAEHAAAATTGRAGHDDLAWLPWPGAAPVEPTRVRPNACLLEDLEYMRAPLFRVRGAATSSVRLRAAVPGVVPSRYSERRRRHVAVGSVVLGSRVVDGHRCVYAASANGLYTGFLPTTRLERIYDPRPRSTLAMVGDWFEGAGGRWIEPGVPANHVRVDESGGGGLHLRGEASWGGGDHPDLHVGGFDAPVRHEDGVWIGERDCRIALRMRGPFLMVDDDGACGGANVTFVGIYVRASSPIPFVLQAM